MLVAPPIGTMEMRSLSRFRPRRLASASSARWSLTPSTSRTVRRSDSTARHGTGRPPYAGRGWSTPAKLSAKSSVSGEPPSRWPAPTRTTFPAASAGDPVTVNLDFGVDVTVPVDREKLAVESVPGNGMEMVKNRSGMVTWPSGGKLPAAELWYFALTPWPRSMSGNARISTERVSGANWTWKKLTVVTGSGTNDESSWNVTCPLNWMTGLATRSDDRSSLMIPTSDTPAYSPPPRTTS